MKRLTILFMLFLTSCILYAKDRKGNDLSGPIALKGELNRKVPKLHERYSYRHPGSTKNAHFTR